MRTSRRARRVAATLVAAAIGAGVVAGCGSDDDGGSTASTTGTTTTAKSTFTGDPVKVFIITGLKTAQYNGLDSVAAARAGIQAINDGGGLGGREVVLQTCNDTDANAEIDCARKAVDERAVAYVGSSMLFNAKGALDILAKAKIPSLAPNAVTQAEYSSPANYPVTPTSFGVVACPQLIKAETGATSIGTIAQDLPAQQELIKLLGGVAQLNGLKYAAAPVSGSQADFAAPIQKVKGSDVLLNLLTPTVQTALYTAIRSTGSSFKATCTITNTQGYDSLRQLGDQADSIYFATALPPTDEAAAAQYPLVATFRKQLEAAAKAGDGDAAPDKQVTPTAAFNAWLGVEILRQVGGKVEGDLTGPALTTALNGSVVDLTGAGMPKVDFSKPVPAKGFERMFNPTVRLLKWDASKGDLVAAGKQTANVLQVFAALAKAGGGK